MPRITERTILTPYTHGGIKRWQKQVVPVYAPKPKVEIDLTMTKEERRKQYEKDYKQARRKRKLIRDHIKLMIKDPEYLIEGDGLRNATDWADLFECPYPTAKSFLHKYEVVSEGQVMGYGGWMIAGYSRSAIIQAYKIRWNL